MGKHPDHALLHQRRHAQGIAGIFREHQEGAAERQQAAVQRHAIHDVAHAELAHPVGDVVAARVAVQWVAAGPVGQVGAGQVGGTADPLGQRGDQALDGQLTGLASSHSFGLFQGGSQGGLHAASPVGGQITLHAAAELGGLGREGLGILGELVVPQFFHALALGLGVPTLVDILGDNEWCVVPAQILAGGVDFGLAQGGAMHVMGAFLVGRALADDGLALDQGGLVGMLLGFLDGGLDGLGVMAVDIADHVPTIGLEALRGVVGKPAFGVAIDGDAVVVPEGDQLAQAPGAGQGAGFVGDTFHHAAVAHEHIGVVIDDVVAGLVEFMRQQLFGQRHADRVGDALAQRPGGGLNAGGVAVLGVTGSARMQLAEILEVVDGQVIAGQMQQGVDQHGTVAVGQYEAVAVGPLGVGRVMAQVVIPDHFGDLRHAHGGAWVAGFGLFNRIHGQGADGICKFGTGCHVVIPCNENFREALHGCQAPQRGGIHSRPRLGPVRAQGCQLCRRGPARAI